jgi:hypothetical protein
VRTRARRRVSQPRRPPTHLAPFLEPRQHPALAPRLISRSSALSRSLPTPPASAGDPRPRSRPSSSPETAPSLLELRPEVRHLSPCPIFPIALYARPRRTVVLAWWLADLSRSSSPALVPKVPLPLLKLDKALVLLKPLPHDRNASPSSSGPPKTFSPPFSPLCPWILGLFPAIEFAVAFSPSLPNSGDPRATLARASLNSGDPTAAERNSAARSRSSPLSVPLCPIFIARLRSRITLRARAPDALARLSAPKSPGAGPARSVRPPPLPLTPLARLSALARPPARPPSVADLISAVGFRSNC